MESGFPGGKGFVPSVRILYRPARSFTGGRVGHSSGNGLTGRKKAFLVKKVAVPPLMGLTDRKASLSVVNALKLRASGRIGISAVLRGVLALDRFICRQKTQPMPQMVMVYASFAVSALKI